MPELKTRRLFISHAWSYNSHYNKLVEWFDDKPNFSWTNYSVPNDDGCTQKTRSGLKTCITNKMRPAQGIIILAGMYAIHSNWIDYEIYEAVRMGKTIFGVRPWGKERTPTKIQDASDVMVIWNSASIISTVRTWI